MTTTDAPPIAAAGARGRLAFFLSFGGSLGRWAREGILDREMLLPLTYIASGTFDGVTVFSYDPADIERLPALRERIPAYAKVELVVPPFGTGNVLLRLLYSLLGPLWHRQELRRATVLKTNQISGAWAAMIAGAVTGRPLVLRLGYVLSRRHRMNGQRLAAAISSTIEQWAFNQAASIVVTSEEARRIVAERTTPPGKVHLVPTYVDTSLFTAQAGYDFSAPLLYVGRLTPQKNLANLIRACAALKLRLGLVGAGDQQAELEALARELGAEVTFHGRLDNNELPALMARHAVFVLPSLHEGLPKVLIEAMSAGMICVGTDIPGIADLIVDGKTGYLAPDTSADGLQAALSRALAERKPAVGAAARALIESKFGIQTYAAAEGALLLGATVPPASAQPSAYVARTADEAKLPPRTAQ